MATRAKRAKKVAKSVSRKLTAAKTKKKKPARPKETAWTTVRRHGSVDQYILSVPVPCRAVLEILRDTVMTAVPGASCTIKWGQPVFELDGPFAWMKAFGKHVGFGFFRGSELPDPEGVLEGKGKTMRHVKIVDPTHIPVHQLDALVREAVKLGPPRKVR